MTSLPPPPFDSSTDHSALLPPIRFLFPALILFVVAMEAAIPAWHNSAPVSEAPVFTLPMAAEALKNPGKFQGTINVYNADRGAELKLGGPEGEAMTVFYFEWDQVETGPIMDIGSHAPEVCNVAAGFTPHQRHPNRKFEPGHGQKPFFFDTSTFTDPAGRTVQM